MVKSAGVTEVLIIVANPDPSIIRTNPNPNLNSPTYFCTLSTSHLYPAF